MTRLRLVALGLALFLTAGLWVLLPQRQDGLVIYSTVDAAPEIGAAFAREAGVPVVVIDMSGGPLLARISAEAHHPRWVLAWFEGDGAAAALDRAGLLARRTTPSLDWTLLGRTLQPQDGSWTVTGFTLAGVLAYRADVVARPVETWNGLLGEAASVSRAPRFGLADPALSGPAFPMLVGLLAEGGGWPRGQGLVRRFQDIGLRVLPSNPAVMLALRAQQIQIGIVQSAAAFSLAAGDGRYRVTLPHPAVVLPSIAAIAADALPGRRALAARFVAFAMTPRMQALRMSQPTADRLYWPVTRDIDQPNLPPASNLSLLHPDPVFWGARQGEVTDWFEQMVASR